MNNGRIINDSHVRNLPFQSIFFLEKMFPVVVVRLCYDAFHLITDAKNCTAHSIITGHHRSQVEYLIIFLITF